jgi:hypothetical protein
MHGTHIPGHRARWCYLVVGAEEALGLGVPGELEEQVGLDLAGELELPVDPLDRSRRRLEGVAQDRRLRQRHRQLRRNTLHTSHHVTPRHEKESEQMTTTSSCTS